MFSNPFVDAAEVRHYADLYQRFNKGDADDLRAGVAGARLFGGLGDYNDLETIIIWKARHRTKSRLRNKTKNPDPLGTARSAIALASEGREREALQLLSGLFGVGYQDRNSNSR